MSEAAAPWHPFLVHFPIAMWTIGSLVLLVALSARRRPWLGVAWFMLALAAVLVIPAVLSGQNEIRPFQDQTIPALTRHRDLGNLLPWLMGLVVALRVHGWLSKKKSALPEWCWCPPILAISALMLYTAWLGGRLVYLHGLGVTP